VASGGAVGVAVGVASGGAVGVAVGVASGGAVGVAVGVASGVAVGVAVGVASGGAVGVAVGVASGVAVGVAVGVGREPANTGVTVIKLRLRIRKIDSKIFVCGIFSPQFLVRPHLAGHRGFISRIQTTGSAGIIRMRSTKSDP
jgi:hypothetical protein